MNLLQANTLKVDALTAFTIALLEVLDIGTDIAQDGVNVDDVFELSRLVKPVKELSKAPLAVAQLFDIDEYEEAEVKEAIKAKAVAIQSDLTGVKLEKLVSDIFIAAVTIAKTVNIFRK